MSSATGQSNIRSALKRVEKFIKNGQFPQADEVLTGLSQRAPANTDVLALWGEVAAQRGQTAGALELFQTGLSRADAPADYRRILHRLLVADASYNLDLDIDDLLAEPVPVQDAAGRVSLEDMRTVKGLAAELVERNQPKPALRLLNAFWKRLKNNPNVLVLAASARQLDEDFAGAVELLSEAHKRLPRNADLLVKLSSAAVSSGNDALALKTAVEYHHHFPVYIAPYMKSQTLTLGHTGRYGAPRPNTNSAFETHFVGNFMSQIVREHADKYRVISAFLDSGTALEAIEKAPQPDLVINGFVNAEIFERSGLLQRFEALIDYWDCNTLNLPENVIQTVRVAAPRLYQGIDGLLVPRVAKFDSAAAVDELVKQIEDAFDYPMIVRGPFEQLGGNMRRPGSRKELIGALQAVQGQPYFYVIQFHDNRHANGLYRKLRAGYIDGVPYLLRVVSNPDWKVHGRSSDEQIRLHLDRRELLDMEIAFCKDPERHLGKPAMDALRAIGQHNPLDIFGLDFDVLPDGRVLFFEANASMRLLASSAHPDVPYPAFAEQRFLEAFDKFARFAADYTSDPAA